MKITIQDDHRIEIHPDTSQPLGFYRRTLRPGVDAGYNETMLKRCEEIREQILRHVEGLALSSDNRVAPGAVRITYSTRGECSFCYRPWEELTAEDIEKDPNLIEEPGDGPGLPQCCVRAQEEWREANVRMCAHQTGGGYDSPPEYCDEIAEKDSDYCAPHTKSVAALEALVEKTAAFE